MLSCLADVVNRTALVPARTRETIHGDFRPAPRWLEPLTRSHSLRQPRDSLHLAKNSSENLRRFRFPSLCLIWIPAKRITNFPTVSTGAGPALCFIKVEGTDQLVPLSVNCH